jgi:protein-S-isoprenylcysteine O-methyltransferase Ste14
LVKLAFAWFAAAVFVASLGFFLYAYFVLFGSQHGALGTAHPARSTAWNVLLFTIFALHHSVFARTGIKRRVKAWVSPDIERASYTLVASVLFILVCWCWLPIPGSAWRLDGVWRWSGYAVQATGVAVTFASAHALDVLDLAGVRQVQRTSPDHAPLATHGLYGFVRHPLYFGWALLVFSAPVMTLTRLVFAVVSTLYLMIAVPFEERSLIEIFGPDYASYQRSVRWRMFPGVY